MKKYLIILFILTLSLPSYAGMVFFPAVEAGLESNDNIDQASKEALSSTAIRASVGLALEGYYNPDLYCRSLVAYKGWSYTNSAYGSLGEGNINLGFDYDINERSTFSLDGDIFNYTDSELTDNNSQTGSLAPKLTFKFTPYSAVGIYGNSNRITYATSDEAINDQKTGAFLSHNFTDWFSATIGGYNKTSLSALVDTYDFRSNGAQLDLGLNMSDLDKLTLSYAPESISYPNWATSRIDQKTTATISYKKYLNGSFTMKINYDQIQNNSEDDSRTFKNNIAYLGIAWDPGFGNIYSDVSETEWEYYFSEGMDAYDRQDWAYAEKLFRKTAFLVDNSDDTHYYLGYCLNKQGKYGESISELKRTIELNENYIEAYYALSYAYIRNREREKAHTTLLKLLEITNDQGLKGLIDDIWKK